MVSHEGTRIRSWYFLIGPCVHGQTYVYMAWTWHVALSNIKVSCKLTTISLITISHPVIDSSDIVLLLLLSLQHVHCSHVWVWVMHVGSVDVRVMIPQYRRWSLSRSCSSYTHANRLVYESGLSFSMATDDPRRREDTRMDMEGRPPHPQ